jgi:hypothetical protein
MPSCGDNALDRNSFWNNEPVSREKKFLQETKKEVGEIL